MKLRLRSCLIGRAHDLAHEVAHDLAHNLAHDLAHEVAHDLAHDLAHEIVAIAPRALKGLQVLGTVRKQVV